MRNHFILKAHAIASADRQKIIEEAYPVVFAVKREVYIKELIEGNWYQCTELEGGCTGFNGYGKFLKDTKERFHGLLLTDIAVFLQQVDGKIWNVKGKFFNTSKPEARKNSKK
jgi:hypothetical protein